MKSTLKNNGIKYFLMFGLFFNASVAMCMEVPIENFPTSIYAQNANDYVSPSNSNYGAPLFNAAYQQFLVSRFYNHYYASDNKGLSPWSMYKIARVLPAIIKKEGELLADFNNKHKPQKQKHYAENFQEHDTLWWNNQKENMALNTISTHHAKPENRAIVTSNTHVRILPDVAPDFFHASIPGQGFPFDNLQQSAIWVGTPLYVIGLSKDKAWSFVLTPHDYFGWVKSNDIAYVSSQFIGQWQKNAKRKLVAVTTTEASVTTLQQQFQFTGYIGAVFPLVKRGHKDTFILMPTKTQDNQAKIQLGVIPSTSSSIMPLSPTAKNIIKIVNQLKNRPYGWGGAFFYNDCSQEMKSLFTPFSIWLPRDTSKQVKLNHALDLSTLDLKHRLKTLKQVGHPLMTLIYIGDHVMLYVGQAEIDGFKNTPITYQNIWEMSPKNNNKRYVIGKSMFFPLLKQYNVKPDALSQAAKKQFKLLFLDKLT